MTKGSLSVFLLASVMLTGCKLQNKTELFTPTAPSAADLGSSPASSSGGTQGSSGAGSPGSASTPSPSQSPSPFDGDWDSGNLPGLPQISSCSNLHWSISSQTPSSVTGEISATCGGVADITADLTGELDGDERINLTAKGSAI